MVPLTPLWGERDIAMSKPSYDADENSSPNDIFLKARRVQQRYGVSHMWIERRQKDAGFPSPIFFGAIRFWKLSDLERWEANQKAAPRARAARNMKAARAAQ